MLRALLAALLLAAPASARDPDLARGDRVEIAPMKTSIYVGTVAMTMPTAVRRGDTYEADYAVKVFPYFFYNETGRLSIGVTDDMLRRLGRGETVDFQGQGVNAAGAVRRVEGRAAPTGPDSGAIKVRVFVTKRIQLVFNTTYRFVP